jgi:hypothetical protein
LVSSGEEIGISEALAATVVSQKKDGSIFKIY